jgi:hypothetical protein
MIDDAGLKNCTAVSSADEKFDSDMAESHGMTVHSQRVSESLCSAISSADDISGSDMPGNDVLDGPQIST